LSINLIYEGTARKNKNNLPTFYPEKKKPISFFCVCLKYVKNSDALGGAEAVAMPFKIKLLITNDITTTTPEDSLLNVVLFLYFLKRRNL
jgi:hypothetical protein